MKKIVVLEFSELKEHVEIELDDSQSLILIEEKHLLPDRRFDE